MIEELKNIFGDMSEKQLLEKIIEVKKKADKLDKLNEILRLLTGKTL